MSGELYADLAWLPKSPVDFRERCHALVRSHDVGAGATVAQLASYRLNQNQLRVLANAIESMRSESVSLHPLTPCTLGVIGNSTLEPLVPVLVGSAARHGIDLRCVVADFGQTIQEATVAGSKINSAAPDAVLIALDIHAFHLPHR